jgi:hypothetical protein
LAAAAALGLLLAAGRPAAAQIGLSLNRSGSGARAAGMGDAFVAISDDGTAATWNPAGLAQLRQPEFSFVYVANNRGLLFAGMRSFDDRVAYTNQTYNYTNSSPEFASAAVPFSIARRPVTVQAGWQRLYQLGADITGNVDRVAAGTGAAERSTVSRSNRSVGNIDVLSVSGAVKLTSRLSLGGTVNWWRGDWSEQLSIVEPGASPGPPAFLFKQSHPQIRGHSFVAGLLLGYPAWTIGLVYHAPAWSDLRLEGEASATGATPTSVVVDGARFRWPRSMAAGLSRRLGSRWTAAGSLTSDQWTDTLVDGVPGTAGVVNFFDEAPTDLTTTRDTLSVNFGVERLFVRDGAVVPLRFGFGWEPQGSMDPVMRDPIGFLLFSAGGGYNTNRFKLDAAVQYRSGGFRASDTLSVDTALAGGLARDAEGRAETHEWRIKVSAIYRIQDTDKLRSILRKIFG